MINYNYSSVLLIQIRMEQSLLIIKPDGVARSLSGEILTRFEKKGFKICGMKFIRATADQLKDHYAEHVHKSFYADIEASMMTGPILVFVLEGPVDTVKTIRQMLGATDPLKSAPGTIRGDYCLTYRRNICHASDSVEAGLREIAIWFKPDELIKYDMHNHVLIYPN